MSNLPGYTPGVRTVDEMFAPPRQRRLSADDIEKLATIDPTTRMAKGRLKAMLERSTDPTDPARPLVEALLAVPTQNPPPAPYINPAKVTPHRSSARSKRHLTPTDIEWIKSLPSDPSKVCPEDVSTLAGMVQNAASVSDLRFLKTVFEPIWQHHDILEQKQERRTQRQQAETTKAARNRTIEHLTVQALTAHIRPRRPNSASTRLVIGRPSTCATGGPMSTFSSRRRSTRRNVGDARAAAHARPRGAQQHGRGARAGPAGAGRGRPLSVRRHESRRRVSERRERASYPASRDSGSSRWPRAGPTRAGPARGGPARPVAARSLQVSRRVTKRRLMARPSRRRRKHGPGRLDRHGWSRNLTVVYLLSRGGLSWVVACPLCLLGAATSRLAR